MSKQSPSPATADGTPSGDGSEAVKPAPVLRKGRREEKLKVFTGTANPALADEICEHLQLPRSQCHLARFSDGETYVQLLENVRGADVFVVQPTSDPVDVHLMELLLMIDALKRASAHRITAVIPYFGYARQDRKDKPRVPISSKLVADLLTVAGASRALTMDLHAPQIQGFFDIPVDHLFASPVLVDHFKKLELPDLTIVSPDAGGVERARFSPRRWMPRWPSWTSAASPWTSARSCTSSARWRGARRSSWTTSLIPRVRSSRPPRLCSRRAPSGYWPAPRTPC